MRVIITGASGLLGSAMLREFSRRDEVHAFDRQRLDVTAEPAVRAAVVALHPDVIVNCAAYNDVDGAQTDPMTALRVNAFAVLALARAAADAGTTLVHFSTDFVFDGETDRPYTETDMPNPRSFYASSKLLGDWFAAEAPAAYVLRVESLFGPPGTDRARRGSLGTIVERIRAGEEVPVFVDRTVSPSYTVDVARATRGLLERKAEPGLYHCVNTGWTTWAGIAEEVARHLRRPLRIKPLTLESAKLVAPRPRYCALSNAKLASAGLAMPHWTDALRTFLSQSL